MSLLIISWTPGVITCRQLLSEARWNGGYFHLLNLNHTTKNVQPTGRILIATASFRAILQFLVCRRHFLLCGRHLEHILLHRRYPKSPFFKEDQLRVFCYHITHFQGSFFVRSYLRAIFSSIKYLFSTLLLQRIFSSINTPQGSFFCGKYLKTLIFF